MNFEQSLLEISDTTRALPSYEMNIWIINGAFVALVFVCFIVVSYGFFQIWPVASKRRIVGVAALTVWLALTTVLSMAGILEPTPNSPPPPVILIAFGLFAGSIIAFGKVGKLLVERFAAKDFVLIQSFRIIVELVLWGWAIQGVAPEIMTFEGRNFDIFVGLTAVPSAWLLSKRRGRSLEIGWNLTGMVILGVVLITAVQTMPGPLQQFHGKPDAAIVAQWPYIWLPAFLVPLAYTLHFLSIRKALQLDTARDSLTHT